LTRCWSKWMSLFHLGQEVLCRFRMMMALLILRRRRLLMRTLLIFKRSRLIMDRLMSRRLKKQRSKRMNKWRSRKLKKFQVHQRLKLNKSQLRFQNLSRLDNLLLCPKRKCKPNLLLHHNQLPLKKSMTPKWVSKAGPFTKTIMLMKCRLTLAAWIQDNVTPLHH